MATSTLPVSEVFGPTLQGEGPHAGRPCYFIRTGGCNLSCTWCDTPYSTGTHGIPLSAVPRITPEEVLQQIPDGAMVVVTGGEPGIHYSNPTFQALLQQLANNGCEVHIETNGMILPTPEVDAAVTHFTVSPKLGVPMANKHHTPTLANWEELTADGRAILKAVWDTDDADQFCTNTIKLGEAHGFTRRTIWVMPEGATEEPLQQRWPTLAQAAADAGINATHRLHALAWGDAKGH